MATTIKIKNSVTATTTPTSLVQGEVAINVTDKKVWVGNAATTPIQIVGAGTTGNAAGSNNQVQYNSSGSFAGDADFTFNGTTVTMANDASISGLTVGKGGGAVASNTAFGVNALTANEAGGTNNTAIGNAALDSNTTGDGNTAVGDNALQTNTTASDNTAVGYSALFTNTTGATNNAFGKGALQANTTASFNNAFGTQALLANTTGAGNCSFGHQSLLSNTTGSTNMAFGGTDLATGAALQANTTGASNNAFGAGALKSNTTGNYNSALGHQALNSNTTASNNTAVGYQALYSNTTGTQFVAFGTQAGYSNTSAGSNGCYIGYKAGYSATGSCNTFVGAANQNGNGCGQLVTTGTRNTILGGYDGNQGGLDIRTASNYIVLSDGDGNPRGYFDGNGTYVLWQTVDGNQARLEYRNYHAKVWHSACLTTTTPDFRIYNQNSNGVYISWDATSWSSSSDSRLKTVTGTFNNALADIAQIQPVKFTWKNDARNTPHVGVIAQSVENVVPEAISKSQAIEGDETEYLGVRYTELIPLMIASIQELNAKVEAQALEIATLKGN